MSFNATEKTWGEDIEIPEALTGRKAKRAVHGLGDALLISDQVDHSEMGAPQNPLKILTKGLFWVRGPPSYLILGPVYLSALGI